MRRAPSAVALLSITPLLTTTRLSAALTLSAATLATGTKMSLNEFLARSHARLQALQQKPPSHLHIVLGNEAADPDSCVSAIAMAAALDATLAGSDDIVVAPLVLVPRADFKLQLDRVHLLRRAELVGTGDGPAWTPSHVTFGDELDLPALLASSQPQLSLHLVDHNKLCAPLASLAPNVASIVDHHAEEGLYTSTVPTDSRFVELGIGSCSSLVAERLKALQPSLLNDQSICTLLLGALLLDTVNLDAKAKEQKPREASIASELLSSCYSPLGLQGPPEAVESVASVCKPFFDELLAVKTDQAMLRAFPTRDLLRQDYKEEVMKLSGSDDAACVDGVNVGVASITMPLPDLLNRQPRSELVAACAAYATERKLDLLILMAVDLSVRQRYILMQCGDEALRTRALAAMDKGGVDLSLLDGEGAAAYAVGNYKVSRKVLLPLLRAM